MESEMYSRKVMIESMGSYIINKMNVLKLDEMLLNYGEKVTYSKFIGENEAYHITPTKVVKKDDGSVVICAIEAEEREDGYLANQEIELALNGNNEFQFQILSDIINEMDIIYGRYFLVGYLCYDGSFAPIIKGKKSLMFDNYENAENYKKKIQKNYKHILEIKKM